MLPESNRIREDFWAEKFDAVVSTAKLEAQGSMYHCRSYRHPERYAGKTVLIMGTSLFSTEIACSTSPFVQRLIFNARVGLHFI
ncbi:hypothetical protein C8R44DRAFT_881204 [Mycena epipterygia]|nr:hypothetical protein C8R44DRAFT_881204 [Mycena epipterygia]